MKREIAFKLTALISIGLLIFACSPLTTSTIVGGQYEAKTNTTDYFVLPYGSVSLPGQWKKERYNSVSHQQWFINDDSITTAIAFTHCNGYEFSKKGLNDFAFVKAYYEWDSKYLAERLKCNRTILVADSINKYIIWQLSSDRLNNYFLFACNNCNVHNYNISTKKWSQEQKIKFLQDLYLTKK
jgi:hypothetical protein